MHLPKDVFYAYDGTVHIKEADLPELIPVLAQRLVESEFSVALLNQEVAHQFECHTYYIYSHNLHHQDECEDLFKELFPDHSFDSLQTLAAEAQPGSDEFSRLMRLATSVVSKRLYLDQKVFCHSKEAYIPLVLSDKYWPHDFPDDFLEALADEIIREVNKLSSPWAEKPLPWTTFWHPKAALSSRGLSAPPFHREPKPELIRTFLTWTAAVPNYVPTTAVHAGFQALWFVLNEETRKAARLLSTSPHWKPTYDRLIGALPTDF